MAITKEQAIDILDKFDFFQGQRAGRELWNDKPFEVQERDIKNFSNDVALLKEYITEVAPESEVKRLEHILHSYVLQYGTVTDQHKVINKIKCEVAREIFVEIDKITLRYLDNKEYSTGDMVYDLDELKQKYKET